MWLKLRFFFFGNQKFVFKIFFFIRSCTTLKNKKDKEDLRRIMCDIDTYL